MIWFKSCPRCQGDLTLERDLYFGYRYLTCIQCGAEVADDQRLKLLDAQGVSKPGTRAAQGGAPRAA
jgi:hypothetical protein